MKLKTLTLLALSAAFVASAQAADMNPLRVGPSTALAFDSGTANLSKDAKAKLKALVKDARANGKIDDVQIAAWSDNPAPRDNEGLSKPDQDLADRRAKAVHTYLNKALGVSSIDTYNMAARASWLSRTFNTADAELKAEIGRGGDTPMSKDEFQVFKNKGEPSKAVVLVIMKD